MSEAILKVSSLSVDYESNNSFLFPWEKTKTFRAVENINFEIKEGETLGIVGETGSGKSTIAKAVINLLKVSSGKIYFQNNQIANLDEKKMRIFRKEIQMIFQDPLASLNPRMNVGEIISEPLTDSLCGTKVFKKTSIDHLYDWSNNLKIKDPFGDFDFIL